MNSTTLPDLQADGAVSNQIKLGHVGVTNLNRYAQIPGLGTAHLRISVGTDLQADRRGAHMSRFVEQVDNILSQGLSLYETAHELALAARHSQGATTATATLHASSTSAQQTPSTGRATSMPREVTVTASVAGEGSTHPSAYTVATRTLGMTACPCAQQLLRSTAHASLSEALSSDDEAAAILSHTPIATHNQRGWLSIVVGPVKSMGALPQVATLEATSIAAMSAPILDTLKRPDEHDVVFQAHVNPKFVEDAVRDALAGLTGLDLDDEVPVCVTLRNEESIHAHDVQATRSATLGEIRTEMAGATR